MSHKKKSILFKEIFQNPESLQHKIFSVQDTIQNVSTLKNQNNVTYSEKERQSVEINPEVTQMSILAVKDFRAIVITVLKNINKFTMNEKIRNTRRK